MTKATAIHLKSTHYVLYPNGKKERCHNRGTATWLARKFNTKAREVKNGVSK